jgi:hypothetical protein
VKPSRRIAPLAAGLLALAGLPRAAAAQVVAGRVSSAADGTPLENAVVVLLDSARRRLGGTLSDSLGGFLLRAPAAGRYHVRADRVGSASAAAGPLDVAVGDTARVRLALGAGQRLSAVRVTARERCDVPAAAGAQATALWDAVRAALAGAALTANGGAVPYSLERFERSIEPGHRRVYHELRWIDPTMREIFASAPAEQLQRSGWVRQAVAADSVEAVDLETLTGGRARAGSPAGDELDNRGAVFYGPDAATLLSEAFVNAHCLRAVASPEARGAQAGLAFEPVRGRRNPLPDVRGTLWIDTATSELRELEFEYTDLPRPIARRRPGGSVTFRRLPNGAWFVDRWVLRMPVLLQVAPNEPLVFHSEREVGGRTLIEGELPVVPPTHALLTGIVVDSTEDLRPIANAVVRVAGTPYSAVTDPMGRFRFELPFDGTATLSVAHPRLVALGVPATTTAPLVRGRETVTLAAFPSTMTARQQLCATDTSSGTGAISGALWPQRPASSPGVAMLSQPLRRIGVELLWTEGTGALAKTHRRTAETTSSGHYHFCGVPAGPELTMRYAVHVSAVRPYVSWTTRVAPGQMAILEWVVDGYVVRPRIDRLAARPAVSDIQ